MADISKINPNGTEYNLKDATARAGIESSKTLKSSVVTVPDAAPINAEDITVDITPIQDLHGYDRPWAGGAGKNKLPLTVDNLKSANTDGTWSGNSYTINGITFTINTDDAGNVISITKNNAGYATITLVFTLPAGTYILSSGFLETKGINDTYIRNGGTVIARGNSGEPGQTFTLSESTELDWTFRVASSNIVCTPMIRLATETDSTFAPYSNECPIEGWTGSELTQKDDATNPTVTRTYSTDFGETVYGGQWHVTEGGTDNEMGYAEFDGSDDEGWAYVKGFSDGTYQYAIHDWGSLNNAKADTGITNQFPRTPNIDSTPNSFRIGLWLNVRTTLTTLQDWKAYLAQNPLQVCYELATPTTISTPKQNVPMLKGINTVSADCGDTQLKYQPDNVVGELKGEIRAVEAELAEVEENLEIVYEDHVANTSMGIIVDGYSVGDMPFSNALDIAKTGYTPIAVTDTSIVHSTVAKQGEIATHCLLDVTNNRVRFYVHVMNSAASLTIPPNSLTFRVAYKKA